MLSNIAEFFSSQPKIILVLLIAIIAIFIWASLWIVLRCILSYRKMTNAERLQMIESGQAAELLKSLDARARRNRFSSVAVAMAFWVPGLAVLGAAYSTVRCRDSLGIAIVAWSAAVIVGVASIVCATLVMGRQRAEIHS
jgi:hypothetical protein